LQPALQTAVMLYVVLPSSGVGFRNAFQRPAVTTAGTVYGASAAEELVTVTSMLTSASATPRAVLPTGPKTAALAGAACSTIDEPSATEKLRPLPQFGHGAAGVGVGGVSGGIGGLGARAGSKPSRQPSVHSCSTAPQEPQSGRSYPGGHHGLSPARITGFMVFGSSVRCGQPPHIGKFCPLNLKLHTVCFGSPPFS